MPQSLLDELYREITPARTLIERLPEDRLLYKPHEKTRPLGDLAWHMTSLLSVVPAVIQNERQQRSEIEWPTRPESVAAMLQGFDECADTGRRLLSDRTDAWFEQPFNMVDGDRNLFAMTRGGFARWGMMTHFVHHRAQLGLYLRMLGVAVPSLVGPSADDNPFLPKA